MSMNSFTSYGRTKEIFIYFTVVVYYALVIRYTCNFRVIYSKQSCGFSMASRFDGICGIVVLVNFAIFAKHFFRYCNVQ